MLKYMIIEKTPIARRAGSQGILIGLGRTGLEKSLEPKSCPISTNFFFNRCARRPGTRSTLQPDDIMNHSKDIGEESRP